MATIKLKNGSGAPLASDLVQGEPALDLTNKRLYTEDTLGAVIEVGVNPTELNVTNNIVVGGTVDGRDIATDGAKLDGIEASADVTDTANVTAAGALMDSELTSEASVKALNQGVATTDSPTFAGLSTTADVSFGDSDKAIFGAGSDLQIYHDGSGSYINESGTGNLNINANRFVVGSGAPSYEYMMQAIPNGAVQLYHNNSQKLATTSTGIDVTGSVTADGLTSSGLIKTEGTSLGFVLNETDTTDLNSYMYLQSGTLRFTTTNDAFNSFDTRMSISNSTGDISFYEDTGTTAKFFWDASTERLGIGNSSPQTALDVTGTVTADDVKSDLFGAADGSASNPSIRNTGDSNTGFYFPAADTIGVSTGGSEAMRIDSVGRVGIGTASPASVLHLFNSSTASSSLSEGLTLSSNAASENDRLPAITWDYGTTGTPTFAAVDASRSSGTGGNLLFHTATTGGTLTEAMRIDSSGNVGIGTDSPAAPLAVESGSAGTTVASFKNSGFFGLTITPQVGGSGAVTDIRLGLGESLSFSPNNSEAMRIDSSGNVGIGTSSISTSKLHVQGTTGTASAVRVESTAADSDAYYIADNDASVWTWGIDGGNGDAWTLSNAFGLGTPKLTVKTGGNVGIGTDSPAAKLHVYQSANNIIQVGSAGTSTAGIDLAGDGATAGTDSYRLYQDSGKTAYVWNYANTPLRIGTNNDEAMRIDSSGNLLVGKTSASSSTDGAELKDGDGVSAIIGTSNQSNAASGNVMILNRRTTDGEIVDFRKDGASVGSIGAAGSRVYISGPSSSLHSGLIFTDNGSEGIIAPSTNAGAVANGTTDLGYSGGRFKDGHFSGNINANTFTAIDGLYVGGTGFANKLDDYEEGGWTPVVADASSGGNEATTATAVGRYTKVGRVVTVDCYINNVTTTGLTAGLGVFVTDLPFIAQGATYAIGSVEATNVAFTGTVVARVDNSGTYVRLVDITSGGSSSSVIVSDLTSGSADIIFTATYMAV